VILCDLEVIDPHSPFALLDALDAHPRARLPPDEIACL
jgi:hypothetical protein